MKKTLIFLLLFLTTVTFINSKAVLAQNAGTKVVKAIEVKGNNTIGIATILSKIKTRVGQEYLQSVVSDDLKRLYNTGYFSDVKVDRVDHEDGLKVIIYLEEKPIVEEVTFSKTKYLKGKSLKRKIKTTAGKFLDKKDLKDDIDTIKELYSKKGFIQAEVEEEVFVDEVTNKVSIHFIVREGYRVRIKNINVLGCEAYKKKKILRVIKTRKKTIFTGGYLKEEMLKEDMGRITSFYEQNGFIDAKAEYTTEALYKGRVEINIKINEGKRYSVGNVVVLGNRILSDKEIFSVMEYIEEGNVFSREKLSVDLAGIRTLYFDRGYIFANVEESTSLDTNTGKVEVKINIVEGGLAYIEKIKVQGNTRTRDIVIRRELRMFPGDRFDGTKLRRSKERLSNLGYFEEVDFDIEDTDALDRKNLVVQIKEAKTGTFSFGGGFSTVDQVVGFVEIEQRNFDFANWPTFTGGGQQLKVRAETGSTKNNLLLSFTEPWIFDYPVSGGFDIYRRVREREENTGYAYDEERIGGAIRFGKQFNDIVSGGVSYKREEITIENFETGVSADLLDEEGTNTTSMIGFTLSRDTRDSVFSPTKGLSLSGGFDVAGSFLGGDKDFFRLQARSSYYIPLKFKSVLEFRVQGGYVNAFDNSSKVPIFERFFAGGASTIRGYDERKVGPLDSSTNDPIGGESMFVANIEYTIPLIDFIKLAAFFDSGNVWPTVEDFGSDGFKSGMGLGLRVKTPVGPINLDYGYPLNNEPGEDGKSGKFYFSVSRGF
ncbi:MAG: outer membrane protein assembly factor BamA [Candidatus Omnitrophica bacterium]|nr:outer membrane protein assembly factor BamA [Candidatus Omnitrophota bacterium]MBU1995540.1 outer membrane protein assembly factor BamA [Candidatus Omnitrophota bacterium]